MTEKQTTIRYSNMELLRIICMCSIIGIHIITQTDARFLRQDAGINYTLLIFLGYGGRLVCNCFVMIGAWFLTERKFKAERIVNLWLEVLFYSVIITLSCVLFDVGNVTIITLVQAFFPIFGRPVWFAAEYICMLFLSPYMNDLLEKNLIVCKKLLIILGGLIVGCATLFPVEHTTPAFSELIWFCFLYLLVGYWKKKPKDFCNQGKKCWMMFIMMYFFLCISYMMLMNMGIGQAEKIANYYMTHYETGLAFVCSVFLFYAVKNTHIPYNKCINTIGGATFAVYLIHQIPAFYPYLWNGIFQVNKYVGTRYFIFYILLMEIVLFSGCTIIDMGRKWLFEHIIQVGGLYNKICIMLERFISIE